MTQRRYSPQRFMRRTVHAISRPVAGVLVHQRLSDGRATVVFGHVRDVPSKLVHRLKNGLVHLHGVANRARAGIAPTVLKPIGNIIEGVQFVQFLFGEIDADRGISGHARGSNASGLNVPGGSAHGP